MKSRITEKQLRRFYRLVSVPMIDFDCGKLCAPANDGTPACCDNENVVPVLFREEFNLHRNNGRFWKRMPPKNKTIKKFIDESASYYVFSSCPGPGGCRRSRRSLNCRTFPFEPYISRDGQVLGLVYTSSGNGECALVGKSQRMYNPVYISNSITFWRELFDLFPEEKELYIDESKKHERRLTKQGKKLRIFK